MLLKCSSQGPGAESREVKTANASGEQEYFVETGKQIDSQVIEKAR